MDDVQKPILSLVVDLAESTPVARQIVDELRVLLVRGDLAPGDSLPSSRRLAIDLGVHFNTVAQAYRELEAEGWLDLRRKRGTFVRERKVPSPAPGLRNKLRQQADQLVARYRAAGLLESDIRMLLTDSLTLAKQS